jgi:uncharacterized protein (DUF433 family)
MAPMAAKESTNRRGSLGFEDVVLDEHGVPVIAGTNTKVVEVVGHWRASDETAAELAADLPHLTVEQIAVALEYYRTHQEEIDEDIERRAAHVNRLREELGQPPYVERLSKLS